MADIVWAKDLRPGNTFLFKGNLYQVIENSFNKTAMREGIVKCKVKNLRTGSITIEVLTGEKLEKASVTTVKMLFSYDDGSNFVFMDNSTYETIEIPHSRLEWEKNFIVEGTEVSIQKYEDEILGVSLPDQIVAIVSEAEEAVQGNTVTSVQKKAWITSGLEIQVPQFIKKGDKVLVNTTNGEYVGRTH
ncbi:MAG: elongation factor P [Mycoplasmataceae bacterium]|nr:elongation factor P [Mycoplasmataceae bacterium]